MSFPLMNKRPRQAVVIPDLSGGMNLRDSVSMVQDNQLTDSLNMWFRDGVLKNRPGIANMEHFENDDLRHAQLKTHDIYTEKTVEVITDEETLARDEVDEICRLLTAQTETAIRFYWVGRQNFVELPALNTEDEEYENYFVVQKDENLFCYLSSQKIYSLQTDEFDGTSFWKQLGDEDLYTPLIFTNGLSTVDVENYKEYVGNDYSGDMIESSNLLSNRYRVIYSTVNKDLITEENTTVKMAYALPYKCDILPDKYNTSEGRIFTAKITRKAAEGDNYVIEHKAVGVQGGGYAEESKPLEDGLRMVVYPKVVVFYSGDSEEVATVGESDYLFNNLEIFSYFEEEVIWSNFPFPRITKDKVFAMSKCTWFGGGSEGINGGTRLFLCGNTKEKNLVVWSDLNNPLYFPENNYFYVGESSSPVTAFGKQADMLVIFKSNETYFAQYQRNTGITADAVTSQAVIDIAASSVYFPLTLINANIGCDCPDTVQLCRNRLVWANADGRVYTLVSNNQYSERNVFEIGEMIHRKLKTEKDLKNARSIDWNGYYLLQTGGRIYVLDYNSYGFQYVSSYSKTEDANLRIPWYFWQLEFLAGSTDTLNVFTVDGNLMLALTGFCGIFKAMFSEDNTYDSVLRAVPETSRDYRLSGNPIKSELQTKLFEFNAQGYYKNVDKVSLSLGNNGGSPITVSFITDMGTEETEITPEGENTQAFSASYVKSVQFNPCIRQVERFGVKLSCDGPLAVDGITLTYRITGGVR